MKKLFCIVLVFLISVFVFSACNNKGKLEFNIDEEKRTLTISGSGAVTKNLIDEDDERIPIVETIEFSDDITALECSLVDFSNVSKVVFGKNFSDIGYNVDEYKSYVLPLNIKEIEIDKNNTKLTYSANGVLSNQDTIFYCTNKQLESYECPDYIKYINEGAFEGVSLKNLVLNDGLEAIRSCAFCSEYNAIDTLIIPESVKIIKGMAFAGSYGGDVTNIREVVFKGNTVIGGGAFYMSGVEKVDFGSGEVEVGPEAFFCCKIEELNICDNVKSIDRLAFSNNPLNKVYISANVSDVDTSAFRSSSGDLNFVVDENNATYCSDAKGSLYSKDMSTLFYIKECEVKDNKIYFGDGFKTLAPYCVTVSGQDEDEEFIVSDTVTEIQDYAFDYVYVNNIVIPASVVKLGQISVGEMDYYNYKSVTILNPECNLDNFCCGTIETIKGSKGSTAEKFAKDNEINFEVVG